MSGGAGEPPPVFHLPTLWGRRATQRWRPRPDGCDTDALATGLRISGHVVFDGGALPSAAEMPRIGIGLVLAYYCQAQLPPPAPVNQNTRQFWTAQYPADQYVINVTSEMLNGWSVRSAMAGGVNVFERPLTLSGQDVSGVVVTLRGQLTTLSGQVRRGSARRAICRPTSPCSSPMTARGFMTACRAGVSCHVCPAKTAPLSSPASARVMYISRAAVGADKPVDGTVRLGRSTLLLVSVPALRSAAAPAAECRPSSSQGFAET